MSYEDDKAKIDASLKELETISEAFKEIEKQGKGQEELIQSWKTEVGDFRKERKTLTESGVDAESIKKLVDKVEEMSETIKSSTGAPQGGAKSKKDWDEKELSDTVKAKADEVYGKLDAEQKKIIINDSGKRKQFLEAAKDALDDVPESMFDEPGKKEPTKNDYRELFGLTNKDASHVPGSNKGSSMYAGAGKSGTSSETPPSRRLVNGAIPRGGQDS